MAASSSSLASLWQKGCGGSSSSRVFTVLPAAQQQPPTALLEAFQAVFVNGGTPVFARFSVSVAAAEKGAVESCNRLQEALAQRQLIAVGFPERLLTSPAVAALPAWEGKHDIAAADGGNDEERAVAALREKIGPQQWDEVADGAALADDFAALLTGGGAYESFSGSSEEAKTIGLDACASLLGDGDHHTVVVKTGKAWCGWFGDVAWDATWVGYNTADHTAWLLCVTDTD
jgi:hypothetical protein